MTIPLFLLLLLLPRLDSAHSFRSTANTAATSVNTSTGLSDTTPAVPTTTALSSQTSNNEDAHSTENTNESLSVGFLGCGTIASSIARGLHKASQQKTLQYSKIIVSERSTAKSQQLVHDLASTTSNIQIASNNQDILDNCNLIFLTVLPQQAREVLTSLKFDPDRHVLVSLVSTATLDDLVSDSKLDRSRVAKMICLPSIAHHEGVALLCCGEINSNPNSTRARLTELFQACGGVVCLDTEADLEASMVTTCTMGPLYGTMKHQRDWLLNHTSSLSKDDATKLVIQQFAGAVLDALKDPHKDRLEDLIDEQTPGGLNEQALKNYGTVLNGFADLQEPVMDAILSRIRGETDGSIESKGTN